MLKIIFGILALVLVGGIAYAVFFTNEPELTTEEVAYTGTSVCLPHAHTSGPTTMECAFGLRTDDGRNYALDTSGLAGGVMTGFDTDERIEVRGTLTPRELMDENDRLLTYDIAGVISVDSMTAADGEDDEASAETHVMAGGELSFEVPEGFGLAVTEAQVLVDASVPPCSEDFDYCIYYNDPQYANTNFESAGVRLSEREDLATAEACLTTPPAGYTDLTPTESTGEGYTMSSFAPLRNAATGQASTGSLYRISTESSCYEFETRIGWSNFENAATGTEEFAVADRTAVEERLAEVLNTIRFTDRENEAVFEL